MTNGDFWIAMGGMGIFLLILLALIGAAIWAGISTGIEDRHRRQVEIMEEQRKMQELTEKQWNEQFGKIDKKEADT